MRYVFAAWRLGAWLFGPVKGARVLRLREATRLTLFVAVLMDGDWLFLLGAFLKPPHTLAW